MRIFLNLRLLVVLIILLVLAACNTGQDASTPPATVAPKITASPTSARPADTAFPPTIVPTVVPSPTINAFALPETVPDFDYHAACKDYMIPTKRVLVTIPKDATLMDLEGIVSDCYDGIPNDVPDNPAYVTHIFLDMMTRDAGESDFGDSQEYSVVNGNPIFGTTPFYQGYWLYAIDSVEGNDTDGPHIVSNLFDIDQYADVLQNPSDGASPIGNVTSEDHLTITGKSSTPGGLWYQVDVNGNLGWIRSSMGSTFEEINIPTIFDFVTLGSPFSTSGFGDGIPIIWANDAYNGPYASGQADQNHGHVDIFVPQGADPYSYTGELLAPIAGTLVKDTYTDEVYFLNIDVEKGYPAGMLEAMQYAGIQNPDLSGVSRLHINMGHISATPGYYEKGQSMGEVVGAAGHPKIAYKIYFDYRFPQGGTTTFELSPTIFQNEEPTWGCYLDIPSYQNYGRGGLQCPAERFDYADPDALPQFIKDFMNQSE